MLLSALVHGRHQPAHALPAELQTHCKCGAIYLALRPTQQPLLHSTQCLYMQVAEASGVAYRQISF